MSLQVSFSMGSGGGPRRGTAPGAAGERGGLRRLRPGRRRPVREAVRCPAEFRPRGGRAPRRRSRRPAGGSRAESRSRGPSTGCGNQSRCRLTRALSPRLRRNLLPKHQIGMRQCTKSLIGRLSSVGAPAGASGFPPARRRGLNVVGEELRQIVVAVELVLVLDACERSGHGGRLATVRLSVRPAAWLCVRSRFRSERSSCSRRGAFVPRVKQGRGHCRSASRGSRRCGRFRRAAEGTRRARRNGLGARHPATRPRARSSDRHPPSNASLMTAKFRWDTSASASDCSLRSSRANQHGEMVRGIGKEVGRRLHALPTPSLHHPVYERRKQCLGRIQIPEDRAVQLSEMLATSEPGLVRPLPPPRRAPPPRPCRSSPYRQRLLYRLDGVCRCSPTASCQAPAPVADRRWNRKSRRSTGLWLFVALVMS